ncbi:MAG: hypothetical protein WDN28_31710 [Chthoniobacter sp.]
MVAGVFAFRFSEPAFVKRFTELQQLQQANSEKVKGRGYQVGDRELISTMGVASGYLAVLVLALYITNPLVTQLYEHAAALWLPARFSSMDQPGLAAGPSRFVA